MNQANLKSFALPTLAIEQAVLAALMTVAESFEQVSDLLKENDFMPLVINIFIVQLKN